MQTTAALATAESGQRETSTPVALDAGGSMSRMIVVYDESAVHTYHPGLSCEHARRYTADARIPHKERQNTVSSEFLNANFAREARTLIAMKAPATFFLLALLAQGASLSGDVGAAAGSRPPAPPAPRPPCLRPR